MLVSLEIRDMLIIDRLELEFQPGLNVLTGETGAGKSILLDALGFVLGWRGRAALLRKGAEKGEVAAVFALAADHPARAVLREAGLPDEDELVLRRTNLPDGRKVARVNDRRASAQVLRALSDCLVELHGQQDDRGLLDPAGHLGLLDEFAGVGPDLARLRALWQAVSRARDALEAARQELAQARREEDYMRHALDEVRALAPEPGEDEALDARRRLMQAAGRIGEDVARAAAALGSEGAESRLADALRWLEGAAEGAEGRLDAPIGALERALDALGDAQQGVEHALDDLSFDAAELERTEERLFALRALARKHAVRPDELPALADELAARVARLDGAQADIGALQSALQDAQAKYDAAAQKLSTRRRKAAKALDAAMARELAPLKLERAVFCTRIDAAGPGPSGIDRVAFHVATNPGAPPGPLDRIASGGELSRFLLALKVCLHGADARRTMIFDEIDRGVGGATADAVGRRLATLAVAGQVLVVTHSPQVAARGDHHWRVEKSVARGETLSRVIALDAPARVDEIARMLAADTVTDEARAAARALLKG